jgi:hypothetical protein
MTLLFLWFGIQNAQATEVQFVPGDAMFSASVSAASLETAAPSRTLVSPYTDLDCLAMGCGSVGYWRMDLRNLTNEQLSTLTYQVRRLDMSEFGPGTHLPDGGIAMPGNQCVPDWTHRLLVYGDTLNPKRDVITVKYNENFAVEVKELSQHHGEDLTHPWGDPTDPTEQQRVLPVPIDAVIPLADNTSGVVFDASSKILVLLEDSDISSYRQRLDGATFVVITPDGGASRFTYCRGRARKSSTCRPDPR